MVLRCGTLSLLISQLDIAGTDSADAIFGHIKFDDIIWGERVVADDCFATEKNLRASGIRNDEAVFLF